jgi:hypothetical protein
MEGRSLRRRLKRCAAVKTPRTSAIADPPWWHKLLLALAMLPYSEATPCKRAAQCDEQLCGWESCTSLHVCSCACFLPCSATSAFLLNGCLDITSLPANSVWTCSNGCNVAGGTVPGGTRCFADCLPGFQTSGLVAYDGSDTGSGLMWNNVTHATQMTCTGEAGHALRHTVEAQC